MPPKKESPAPAYRPSVYETDFEGLPGLLLFAQTAEYVEAGKLPEELIDYPTRHTPAMAHEGLRNHGRAKIVEDAFCHASKEVCTILHNTYLVNTGMLARQSI